MVSYDYNQTMPSVNQNGSRSVSAVRQFHYAAGCSIILQMLHHAAGCSIVPQMLHHAAECSIVLQTFIMPRSAPSCCRRFIMPRSAPSCSRRLSCRGVFHHAADVSSCHMCPILMQVLQDGITSAGASGNYRY